MYYVTGGCVYITRVKRLRKGSTTLHAGMMHRKKYTICTTLKKWYYYSYLPGWVVFRLSMGVYLTYMM